MGGWTTQAQAQRLLFACCARYALYEILVAGLPNTVSHEFTSLTVTSRTVVWLFLEQFRFEFVPVLYRLQGRLAAQG